MRASLDAPEAATTKPSKILLKTLLFLLFKCDIGTSFLSPVKTYYIYAERYIVNGTKRSANFFIYEFF